MYGPWPGVAYARKIAGRAAPGLATVSGMKRAAMTTAMTTTPESVPAR
ncbi:hypothetical protein M271_33885 [Streptomyces rapamycinicus NRRL 5491]|nr:hypothetical protein M271_33885 [Streptomyces rapamycinicus NRRL 5491]